MKWKFALVLTMAVLMLSVAFGGVEVFVDAGEFYADTTNQINAATRSDFSGVNIATTYTDTLNADTVYGSWFDVSGVENLTVLLEFDDYTEADSIVDNPTIKALIYSAPVKGAIQLIDSIVMANPEDGDVGSTTITDDNLFNWIRIKTWVQDSLVCDAQVNCTGTNAFNLKYYFIKEMK